jgi:uncharacterized protein YegP (UPF0339 family)
MGEYRLEYYRRADGKWDWRVVASNNRIVGTSGGQGYENKGDAVHIAGLILDPMIARNFSEDTSAFDNRGETV